jgi:hypothetical protein
MRSFLLLLTGCMGLCSSGGLDDLHTGGADRHMYVHTYTQYTRYHLLTDVLDLMRWAIP